MDDRLVGLHRIPVAAQLDGPTVARGGAGADIVARSRQRQMPVAAVETPLQAHAVEAALREDRRADHVALQERRRVGSGATLHAAVVEKIADANIIALATKIATIAHIG